ncbi:MAG TPA: ATP synthase F0 subunit B [Pyrinomonadaceae bacterium]|nr:ATP synthase F0 subunit B [Pyrinomonadaceae bacterium]
MFLAESSIQLVPDGTLLIHLLMVAVMVAVLNKTLLKPINRILADREKHILGRVDEAQEMLKLRDEKLNDYNSALRNARSEGYQLLEKERAQALKEKEEKVRAFKEETSASVRQSLKATHDQENQVRGQLEDQAETLGAMITAQILRR